MREEGTEEARAAMAEADRWMACRLAFVETARVLGLLAAVREAERFREEWDSVSVIEVDRELSERAAELAVAHRLRSLDAIHLAAASIADPGDLILATWDRRLSAAAADLGLRVVPDRL